MADQKFIYLLKSANSFDNSSVYKIGCASDVRKRKRNIQNDWVKHDLNFELEIVFQSKSKAPQQVETLIKNLFAPKVLIGEEWIALNNRDLNIIKKLIKMKLSKKCLNSLDQLIKRKKKLLIIQGDLISIEEDKFEFLISYLEMLLEDLETESSFEKKQYSLEEATDYLNVDHKFVESELVQSDEITYQMSEDGIKVNCSDLKNWVVNNQERIDKYLLRESLPGLIDKSKLKNLRKRFKYKPFEMDDFDYPCFALNLYPIGSSNKLICDKCSGKIDQNPVNLFVKLPKKLNSHKWWNSSSKTIICDHCLNEFRLLDDRNLEQFLIRTNSYRFSELGLRYTEDNASEILFTLNGQIVQSNSNSQGLI